MQQGMFHQGRRAAADVWATINLLGRAMPDGETALAKFIRQAEQPSAKIEAVNAHYEAESALKGRGYRWHPARRTWWNEIPAAKEPTELEWLRDACTCERPQMTHVTWSQRHRR